MAIRFTTILSLFFFLLLSKQPWLEKGLAWGAESNAAQVYLLAGQSNMDGRGRVNELSAEQKKPRGDTMIYYKNPPFASVGWVTLEAGYSVAPGFRGTLPSETFGPEIGFAARMSQASVGVTLALIKASKGGTSLAKDWNPGAQGDLQSQGPCYQNLVATTREALTALQKAGIQPRLQGMLWHQGESDSGLGTENYAQRLKEFVKRIREDLGQEDLPIAVATVFDDGTPGRVQIRAAQKQVVESMPYMRLVTVDGLTTSDQGTHLDTDSQIILGQRFAESMQGLF